MHDYYSKLVADPLWFLVWTIFTGCVSFLAGHKFSLMRDRRGEFYEASDRLFRVIRREMEGVNPFDDIVTAEAEEFHRHLSGRSERQFSALIVRYKTAREGHIISSQGSSYYPPPVEAELLSILTSMKAFTQRK